MMTSMPTNCHLRRAICPLAFSILLALPVVAGAQEPQPLSLQQLFEAGNYDGVLQRVAEERAQEREAVESTFLAALALRRQDQNERAREEFQRLAASENPAWRLIGQSGLALETGSSDDALTAATEAVSIADDLGFAHFQLGLVHARRDTHAAAAQSFARAAELMPAFAYAHYYAGLSFQRVRDINRMATCFESFLKLAPNAPERLAVIAIMRSVRG
jgi:tetratricopeptide (TPR) repeat protein